MVIVTVLAIEIKFMAIMTALAIKTNIGIVTILAIKINIHSYCDCPYH